MVPAQVPDITAATALRGVPRGAGLPSAALSRARGGGRTVLWVLFRVPRPGERISDGARTSVRGLFRQIEKDSLLLIESWSEVRMLQSNL